MGSTKVKEQDFSCWMCLSPPNEKSSFFDKLELSLLSVVGINN